MSPCVAGSPSINPYPALGLNTRIDSLSWWRTNNALDPRASARLEVHAELACFCRL
jgi:hypothetical protein